VRIKTTKVTLADIRKQFEKDGFTVSGGQGDSGPIDVRKYNCVHRIDRNRAGFWAPVSPPHFLINGVACELEDKGYQKFWLAEGRRFPIKLQDLRDLQRFDQEVRYILKLKSLWGESLGTTSARTVYDRVAGRPDA
jgi:hypothetical protein